MSITKCLKQAKFHMGYSELVTKYPHKEQELEAIAFVVARVFSAKNKWIYFGSIRAPIKRLKKKLAYVSGDEVIKILGRLPKTGNIRNNIEKELLLING